MTLRYVVFGTIVLSMCAGATGATELRAPTLGRALRLMGNPQLPAAWAGIWSYTDSTHECSNPTIIDRSSGLDTLCTGMPVGTLNCTGTFDDNSANITCTNTVEFDPGCTGQFGFTIVATRNGDDASIVTTNSVTFEPPDCAFIPNACEVTEASYRRIGPEPLACSMSVQPSAWGQIKILYRR